MHCISRSRRSPWFRCTALTVLLCFGITPAIPVTPAYARRSIAVPAELIAPSAVFVPAVMRGLRIDAENPFQFEFIIDTGEEALDGAELHTVSTRLIKYFLAALTVPEQELWVNLSPGESRHIIPERFGTTAMGRDMLAQDFLLKQFASSLMYPEGETGKKFWERVYQRAQQRLGTTDIPVSSFNKVWIVPGEAKVFENRDGAYVVGTRLKVMLEDEYAQVSDLITSPDGGSVDHALTHEIVKEVLIPEIEREVNEGAHFAQLRQIYHSLILAAWYKRTLRNSLLTRSYADQNKVAGVDDVDSDEAERIYGQYMQAVRKGVYDYIREDYDPVTRQSIPRRYMSGGLEFTIPHIDQATLSEMIQYLRSAKPREWKNVMTHLRRPRDWGSQALRKGPYPESPMDLTATTAAFYGRVHGPARRMPSSEVNDLLDALRIERKIKYIKRELGPYDVNTGAFVSDEEGIEYVLLNIGSLFFMDSYFYRLLSSDIREALGANVILLENIDNLELVRPGQSLYASAALVSMLQQENWQDFTVVDSGAGDGILALAALKLGAPYAELVEVGRRRVTRAQRHFYLNGFILGQDYDIHKVDLADEAAVKRTADIIAQRRREQDPDRKIAVVSNIGYWPRTEDRQQQDYNVSNQHSMDLMALLPRVQLFIGSGYNTSDEEINFRATVPDIHRLEDMGFAVHQEAVVQPLNNLTLSFTATRSDEAMLSWRRPGGHGKEGLEISPEPSLTLGSLEIDKLRRIHGTARFIDNNEQRRLLDILTGQDDVYRSSPDVEYFEDTRLNRRDFNRRGTREVLFSQLGPLFLIDRDFYLGLEEAVRQELGTNVIVLDRLNDMQMYSREYAMYTNATLAMMLEQRDWSGRQVLDVGAGEGILALVALKLGADFVELFDNDVGKLETAKNQLRLNGYASGARYRLHAGDLRHAEYTQDRIDQIKSRLNGLGTDPEVTVVANIGVWPVSRWSGREPQYTVTNQKAYDIAERIPGVSMIISGGYNVNRIRDYEKGMKQDVRRLRKMGFRLARRAISYHQTDLNIAFAAVRPDAAIFGSAAGLQEWIRRFRPDESATRGWPAWGRARDLARDDVMAVMEPFRKDPNLITIPWDGELSPGQPYGQFELNGQLLVREDAYIRRANGPGELVIVRLGHLFVVDRSFYMDLDAAAKDALGTNALIMPRLNQSALNSPLFRIYNSSTALAMMAQGNFNGQHVIDVGSGDGLLALIAHKLGAVHTELIERDKFSALRATHILTLNGLDPDTDYTVHLGDVTEETFVRQEADLMIRNMERGGADSLTVVANIGQWEDFYGEVTNRTVIQLARYLPPVDRFILGGYDVSGKQRNAEVVAPDRELLKDDSYDVNEMTLSFAGSPMTVALIGNRSDQALMIEYERIFQETLSLDPDNFERSRLEINGKSINVTQYVHAQFEEVPFFTVGDFMVVNRAVLDRLPGAQRDKIAGAPGIIILDGREFSDAFAYERWEGYGGFTIGVMAAMIAFRDQIAGRTFVDFGAGTGVLSILADRLGARKVVVIEGRDDVQDILTTNLRENNVAGITRLEAMVESIDALDVGDKPVFGLNIPYFGVLTGSGEPSVAFAKAFELVPSPSVAFLSGGSFGRGAVDDFVIKELVAKGARAVIESMVMKDRVSDIELSVSNVFTAVFEDGIVSEGDSAIFSRTSRRRMIRKYMDLADRYITRIPPHFPEPTGQVYTLTQFNPYLDAFLRSLEIDIIVPPAVSKKGIWRYDMPLTEEQQRRLMDRLSQPERVPKTRMPEAWSLIFYGHEPLLLVMQGHGWQNFTKEMQDSILATYEADMLRRGMTDEYLEHFMREVPKLKWSRGLALMPLKSEQVSIRDQRHLAFLEQWLNDMNEGPVYIGDTLFELTPIETVKTPVVTAWGSYNPVTYDGYLFRSGIKPGAGETVYVLGTGVGADAIYAAQYAGGDIRVIASEIDPYQVANARVNVRLSGYADVIDVVQGNLFDFPRPPDMKADRIYFNLPIDSLHAGRKRDPQVGDPGMRLLQRLLAEAGEHLKEDGTLEVTYMARPMFFYHVYANGWKIVEAEGEDLFEAMVPNAHLQPFKYLRFTLQRQRPEDTVDYEQAVRDMRFTGGFEMKSLQPSQRERIREIGWRWGSERTITGRLLHMAAEGVLFYARAKLKPGPQAVKRNRLKDPAFTMLPQGMVILDLIRDQSMLSADPQDEGLLGISARIDAIIQRDGAILNDTPPASTEPWEERSLVRLPGDGLEGVIQGRPFVRNGQGERVPGYVVELKGLPYRPGQNTTRIVTQDLAHRFFQLLEPPRPSEEERAINAGLKNQAEEISGRSAAAVAKLLSVPATKLRQHLRTYPGLIDKYGIDYHPVSRDQAQLSENTLARHIRRAVQMSLAGEAGKADSDPEVLAKEILSGYALAGGDLLPAQDREGGTILSSYLRQDVVTRPVTERLVLQNIGQWLDKQTDAMAGKRAKTTYPAKINYQRIGALVKSRRGAVPRNQAAVLMGISDATLQRIEGWSELQGRDVFGDGRSTKLDSILKVIDYYGIATEELFGRQGRVGTGYAVERIGPNMKYHRDRQGLTVEQAAKRLGIERTNYNKWESGEKTPTFESLVKIARALGVTLDQLLQINLELNHIVLAVDESEQWVYLHERFAMEQVRQRLRKLRLRRGLSTYQVAEAMGRSQGYISELENGQYDTYPVERLREIAAFYRVSLFYLATGLKSRHERESVIAGPVKPEQVRANIKRVREYRGLTRRDLDRLGGFSEGYTSQAERAEGLPLFDNFVRLSVALQIPLEVLLDAPDNVEDYLWTEDRLQVIRHQLRIARERAGLSLEDIAGRLNVPLVRIRRVENGSIWEARVRDIAAVSNLLKVDFPAMISGRYTAGFRDEKEFVPYHLPDDFESRVGEQFKEWLAARNLSQIEFAERAGFSAASQVATGKRDLLVSDLSVIGRFFEQRFADMIFMASGGAADAAVLADTPGGIDFRTANVPLDIERGGSDPVVFDLQDPRTVQIEGLVPIIIQITPVTNIPLLLGLNNSSDQPLADLPADPRSPYGDPRDRMIRALDAG